MSRRRYSPTIEGEVQPYASGKWRASIIVDMHYEVDKISRDTEQQAWQWCDVTWKQHQQPTR